MATTKKPAEQTTQAAPAKKPEKISVFALLNAENVNEHTEKKKNLTYLSWAWAWGIVKKHFPDATYTVYENAEGWNYHTDGRTAWVKTGVTINGQEYIEYLPVMDFNNRSIPLENVTSYDVNKAIQRSLTKAIARHGLGLYIYAGEDLPEGEEPEVEVEEKKPYTPVSEERYWKFVAAAAKGETYKNMTMLELWAHYTHAGPKETEQFNLDVLNYKEGQSNDNI